MSHGGNFHFDWSFTCTNLNYVSEEESATRDVLNETSCIMKLIKQLATDEEAKRSKMSEEEKKDIREPSLVGDIFVQLLQQFTTIHKQEKRHERYVLSYLGAATLLTHSKLES